MALFKKVVMMGSFAVGKTSLVRRLVEDAFDDTYLSTMGVKVSRKAMTVDGTELTLMLWDISGREGFEQLRPSYLKGAAGAILVGDLTRPRTFDTLAAEARTVSELLGDVPRVICANKCDLPPSMDEARIAEQAKILGAPYYLTSARNSLRVQDAFLTLGRGLLAR